MIPSQFNLKALQEYKEIFGNHEGNDCESKAVTDYETGRPLTLKLGKNNFLEVSDIMRYANGAST